MTGNTGTNGSSSSTTVNVNQLNQINGHIPNGNSITSISVLLATDPITIETPKVGELFTTKWVLSKAESDQYIEFSLSEYQGTKGYKHEMLKPDGSIKLRKNRNGKLVPVKNNWFDRYKVDTFNSIVTNHNGIVTKRDNDQKQIKTLEKEITQLKTDIKDRKKLIKAETDKSIINLYKTWNKDSKKGIIKKNKEIRLLQKEVKKNKDYNTKKNLLKPHDKPKGFGGLSSDKKIKITGKITSLLSSVRDVYISLENEKKKLIEFKDPNASAAPVTSPPYISMIKAKITGSTWEITLPEFKEPQFGIITIHARADTELTYTARQAMMLVPFNPTKQLMDTIIISQIKPVKSQFLIFGLQLGLAKGEMNAGKLKSEEYTSLKETLVTDFIDHKPVKSHAAAEAQLRVRRMKTMSIKNKKRKLPLTNVQRKLVLDSKNKPQKIEKLAPRMPDMHCELHLVGCTSESILLYYDYMNKENKLLSPSTRHFEISANWEAEIEWKGGPVRKKDAGVNLALDIASSTGKHIISTYKGVHTYGYSYHSDTTGTVNRIKGKNELFLYDYGKQKTLTDFTQTPAQPLEIENIPAIVDNAKLERHWQDYENPTIATENRFPTTVIPWQPVYGNWVDDKDVKVADIDVDPKKHHYKPKARGGDLIVKATVKAFGQTLELHLPKVRLDMKANPTEAVLKALLKNRLDSVIALTTTARQTSINAFITQLGKDKLVEICVNIINHESSFSHTNDTAKNYFPLKRSFYDTYSSKKFFNELYQPKFGAPAGWGLGQFDNPPPATHEVMWDWTQFVDAFLYRLIIQKFRLATENVTHNKRRDKLSWSKYSLYRDDLALIDGHLGSGQALHPTNVPNAASTTITLYKWRNKSAKPTTAEITAETTAITAMSDKEKCNIDLYVKIGSRKYKVKAGQYKAGRNISYYTYIYNKMVGEVKSPTPIAAKQSRGGKTWYSNEERNCELALEALLDTTSSNAVKQDAANLIAWNITRIYNGSNKDAVLYPYKVGHDGGQTGQKPYYIGY